LTKFWAVSKKQVLGSVQERGASGSFGPSDRYSLGAEKWNILRNRGEMLWHGPCSHLRLSRRCLDRRSFGRSRSVEGGRRYRPVADLEVDRMSEKPPIDTLAFAQVQARALDLPLTEAYQGSVIAHLETAFRLAASFIDFPLADHAEPAPIFVAEMQPGSPKQ
jgi:hypothetical protein